MKVKFENLQAHSTKILICAGGNVIRIQKGKNTSDKSNNLFDITMVYKYSLLCKLNS